MAGLNESIQKLILKKNQFIHDVIKAATAEQFSLVADTAAAAAGCQPATGDDDDAVQSIEYFMEQLLSHADLNEAGQQAIVDAINQIMERYQLVLMQHDQYNSWLLIHQVKKHLLLYSTELQPHHQSLNAQDTALIKKKYIRTIKDPLSEIQFAICPKPTKIENRFAFTIAYALCIAMSMATGQNTPPFEHFRRTLGGDEDTTMVRKIIVEMLKSGQLPRNNDVWQK